MSQHRPRDLSISDEYLTHAVEVAQQAAELARSRNNLEFDLKGSPSNVVTEMDRRCEDLIKEYISDIYPNHGFIGEEHGVEKPESDVKWIIDPIDGTSNYLHNVSPSFVHIAVEIDGVLHAGVQQSIPTGDIYYAVDEEGAYKNHRPITVSTTDKIADQLIAIEVNENTLNHNDTAMMNLFRALLTSSGGVRKHRCSGHNNSSVAQGDYGAAINKYMYEWDMAPGVLLIREAGGTVSTFDGDESWDTLKSSPCEMIASNGHAHDEIIDLYHVHKNDTY